MKFTEEQFKELQGTLSFDDLPFEEEKENLLRVFNALPSHIQGGVVSWGFSDTPNSDNIFEYLIKNQFGLESAQEYYGSGVYAAYKEKGETLKINFDKLEVKK